MDIVRKVTGKCRQIRENLIVGYLPHVDIRKTKWLSYDIQELRTKEILIPNDFYGNAHTIKKYCGLGEDYAIKAALEHATYFGKDMHWDLEINHEMPAIISQGNIRKEVLSKFTQKEIHIIGPYIAYADSYYKDIAQEKDKLGKTLTVFPMHSTTHIDLDYDIQRFINEIERIKGQFDTVRACMYWKDIIRGQHKIYKEKGYDVVCAGHLYDKAFLSRLRSIIELSDCVMSNDVGSYVGQAVYLNKPVYLWRQSYSFSKSEYDKTEEYSERLKDPNYEMIFDTFCKLSDTITEEQDRICDYFWGIHSVQSKDALRELLMDLENKYNADRAGRK